MRLVIGTVIGGITTISRFVINLLTATVARTGTRTVSAYATDAVIADGESLITVPEDVQALAGYRLATTTDDGAALGPEIAKNGDFNTDTDWSFDGVGWSISGGFATCDGGSGINLKQGMGLIEGVLYKVTYTILSYTAGGVRVNFSSVFGTTHQSTGTFTEEILGGSSPTFRLSSVGTTELSVDNICVKQVIPTWYTTDADGFQLPDLRGLSVADATINKCECVKANPVDTTGLSTAGDVAATLTVVDDTAELSLAGLQELCTSGKVYDFDGTAASGSANTFFDGVVANLNKHSGQIWARSITAESASSGLRLGTSGVVPVPQNGYVKLEIEDHTPGSTGNTLEMRIDAGSHVRFILPGLYESSVVPASAPIIGADTAASASSDSDKWSEPTPSVVTDSWAINLFVNPDATGQTTSVFGSFVDSDNYTEVLATAATLILRKRVGGVNHDATFTYTHVDGTLFECQIFGDTVNGTGIRAADGAIVAESFDTDADTTAAQFGATVSFGNLNDLSIFQDTYKAPIFHASKEAAGWV